MSRVEDCDGHVWNAQLFPSVVIHADWCVKCGLDKPLSATHVLVNGLVRKVDDVDAGEAL